MIFFFFVQYDLKRYEFIKYYRYNYALYIFYSQLTIQGLIAHFVPFMKE